MHTSELKGFRDLFQVVARFWRALIPLWDKLLLRITLTQCVAFLSVCTAMAAANVIDRALPKKDTRLLFFWLSAAMFLHVSAGLLSYVNMIMASYMGLRLDIGFKHRMLRHVQRLSLRFHQSRPVGEHMFRVNDDSAAAVDLVGNIVPETIARIQAIATAAGVAYLLNPLIAALILAYIAVYATYAHVLASHVRAAVRRLRVKWQDVSAILQEILSCFVLSKTFARERHDRLRYYNRIAPSVRLFLRFGILRTSWQCGGELLRNGFVCFSHWLVCGVFVVQGRLTVGEYVALGIIMQQLMFPLEQFVFTLERMRYQAVPAERMLETLDVAPEIVEPDSPVALDSPRGEITFDHISFRYTPGGPWVLQDVSFHVPAGMKLAIVGPSGAGKTSVFNLLMRYYDPAKGAVRIDGIDLRELDLRSYHNHVGLVLQENFMFAGAIRDNILFGDPRASEAQLLDAIERAGLRPFLDTLDDGLDTALKEGGDISDGQKQRIALARVLVRNASILYLDEATASLDPPTEREILGQLRRVEAGRTRVMISHNIASVHDADEIIVLDRGLCVQRGAHEELLAEEGLYRRMWLAELEKMAQEADLAEMGT